MSISFQQPGVRQPLEDDKSFSPGALLSRDASLPSDKAKYETALDGQDLSWRLKETNRKFVLIVDNCFPMWMSDPDDASSVGQAAEEFWARHGAKLNVEAFLMKQDENPRTDKGQWLHDDRVFGKTGSAQDPILPDDERHGHRI